MSRPATRRRRTRALGPIALCAWALLGVGGTNAGAAEAAMSPAASDSVAPLVLASPGAGYTVVAEGVHAPATFAPDPAGAADVLITPGGQVKAGSRIVPYERTWRDTAGTNQVDDLLVRFPSAVAATAFLVAVRHSLDSADIVSSAPLPTVPGARRTTYLASTDHGGIGQAVTMRTGLYVDVLAFVSLASGNDQPITAAATERTAQAQYAAITAAPGGRDPAPPRGGKSWSGVVWAVLAVIVLAGAVATPMLLRRRVVPANDARKAFR